MGFVLLGIFAWNTLALQGVVLEMVCHGSRTGALFVIVGLLQERLHTRDMARWAGSGSTAPRMGGAAMLFALASLGLPGLGNFVGEFLILVGVLRVSEPAAVLAAVGLVAADGLLAVDRAARLPGPRDTGRRAARPGPARGGHAGGDDRAVCSGWASTRSRSIGDGPLVARGAAALRGPDERRRPDHAAADASRSR